MFRLGAGTGLGLGVGLIPLVGFVAVLDREVL